MDRTDLERTVGYFSTNMKNVFMMGVLVVITSLFLSGCMLMHGGDMMGHGSKHETREQGKGVEEKNDQGKSETKADKSLAHAEHKKESKPKKSSKTLLILGGIGMGLMMIIMIL